MIFDHSLLEGSPLCLKIPFLPCSDHLISLFSCLDDWSTVLTPFFKLGILVSIKCGFPVLSYFFKGTIAKLLK